MTSIAPPPIRSSVLDALGNLSQSWLGWLRSIHVASQSGLDLEVLAAFAEINRPADRGEGLRELERLEAIPDLEPVLREGMAFQSVSREWDRYFADLEAKLALIPSPREWSDVELIEDSWAHLANYPAGQHPRALFYATDRTVFYRSTGTAWAYRTGEYSLTQSAIAALVLTLGANDAGLLLDVTDFKHRLKWDGAALDFAPGDDGSNYFLDAPAAPIGKIVQLCDGTTVSYLKADGTTANYTTQNLTGHYRKSVTSGANALVAAAAPTFTGTGGTTGNDGDAGSHAASGAGGDPLVALNPHTHSFTPAGTISATGEPPAFKVLTYFRR